MMAAYQPSQSFAEGFQRTFVEIYTRDKYCSGKGSISGLNRVAQLSAISKVDSVGLNNATWQAL